MDAVKWAIIGLLWGLWTWAPAATPTCLGLAWDYQATPRLGSFFIYVSATSGSYPIVPGKPLDSRPTVIVEAIPQMTLSVPCSALRLTGAGPWYLVVTAVALDLTEESAPSNELIFGADAVPPPPVPPAQPPPPPKPPVVLPPPLPGLATPNVPPPPKPTTGTATRLTDTEAWQGVGVTATPPPQRDVPGAPAAPTGQDRLTDTPTWRGQRD